MAAEAPVEVKSASSDTASTSDPASTSDTASVNSKDSEDSDDDDNETEESVSKNTPVTHYLFSCIIIQYVCTVYMAHLPALW